MKANKVVDVRFYVNSEYKKQLKKEAVCQGVSLNKLISDIVLNAIPFLENENDLLVELDNIKNILSKSAGMSISEREILKARKNEIKNILKKKG